MPQYHYLGKNGFPHADNVNVYDYANSFDYARYDYTQMSIQVCSVPWEQGEAHIGQRTLSGIGNVVYFGSKEKRDKWFNAIPDTECFRWDTKFKELHSDLTLRVPLPFDVASNYNYVRVTYNLFANDESLIDYESSEGMHEWFYFIRESRFIAPNTTELVLLDDVWQTWIYDIDITNMILERGHAPMFAADIDNYLSNPIDNCADLLAEDVNFGDLQQVTKTQVTSLNSVDMYAVIITSGNPKNDWGSKSDNDWKTSASAYYTVNGVPSLYAFAVPFNQLNTLLSGITSTVPQFKQTVQCIFFCSAEFLTFGASFTFADVTCYPISAANTVSKNLLTMTKADWGYDSRYQDITKLYTYPYSALVITDEKGNAELVKIEDTSGALTFDCVANLAFPFINLTGVINGIGGNVSHAVSFRNVTQKTFKSGGRWYEHLFEWDIPTFAVVLDASKEFDYSTHFDRTQANNDRSTNRTNTNNIADSNYTSSATRANAQYNATSTSASANRTCENNNAANVVDNASAQTTANTSVTRIGNNAATADANLVNALAQAMQAWEAGLTRNTTNNDVEAANATASISAAGGVVNSAASGAISGALTAGPLGAAAGALGGLASGGISAATSLATNAVAVNAKTSQAEIIISNSQSKLGETTQSNTDRTTRANTAKTNQTKAQNKAITTSAANTASTQRENATTTYNAAISAADTVRDAAISAADTVRDAQKAAATVTYNNEGNRITNSINQAALRAPFVYGSVANAELATSRPMALWVNIITENDYAISLAGDEFLRYGYCYNKQWAFNGDWCVGKHFTFWKLRDYWSTNQIPDRFADQIRFLLYGGITVWSNPEDIGAVTIYDNGI